MKPWKIALIAIGVIAILIALDFGTGYFGVLKTRTVGKARQNAQREVFEQTQSYVEGKQQELIKSYREWKSSDADTKKSIEATVRMSFANFDESKFADFPELYNFLRKCKYD